MMAPTHETDTASIMRMAQADPDRMLCAAFMPPPLRMTACALLAFHNELLRALQPARSSAVAGSLAGAVRLQWWREVLEGDRPPEHLLAPVLLDALAAGRLSRATLLRLVLSAERELDRAQPPEGEGALEAWQAMLRDGAGALTVGMGEILGLQDALERAALEWCGMAYGVAAMLRHWPVLDGSGRFVFPGPVQGAYQFGRDCVAQAESFARQKAHGGPAWRIAALPLVLARRDLARYAARPEDTAQAGQPRGMGDRLALMLAGWKAARGL